MKKIIILTIAIFVYKNTMAQNTYTTRGNEYNVRHTLLGATAIPQSQEVFSYKPATIFASGFCLLAIDINGKQKTAFHAYGGLTDEDFIAGPLELGKNNTDISDVSKKFAKIWSVTASDILQHQEDFKDGKIDNPNPNLMAWPAKGNPHFEAYNFFKNDFSNQDLAPFKDVNGDGIYTPLSGDFPFVAQADAQNQPSEIFWTVFNDNCLHTFSNGPPILVEVQQTGWTYHCPENPILNNTNFLSYKVINKSKDSLLSLRLGYWTDFALGCENDDYSGCSTQNNAFFVYNQDEIDGINTTTTTNTCGGINTFPKDKAVPTASVKFLNQKLDQFKVGLTLGNNISTSLFDMQQAIWSDNTPITKGGNGYNKNSKDTTFFMFDGNPSDSLSWSMKSAKIVSFDNRSLGSALLGAVPSDSFVVADMALSFHNDKSKSNVAGQIDQMYIDFKNLQNAYNQYFKNICTEKICASDCVFPGDANSDGRCDAKDFLNILKHQNNKGTMRISPFLWQGFQSNDWTEKSITGENLKHSDCDGNGIIQLDDQKIIDLNFLKSNGKYKQQTDLTLQNDNFAFSFSKTKDSLNLQSIAGTGLNIKLNINLPKDSFWAYSFELEVDGDWFKRANVYDKQVFGKWVDFPQKKFFHIAGNLQESFFLFLLKNEILTNNCLDIRFKNLQVIRADGSIVKGVGARDLKFCLQKNLISVAEKNLEMDFNVYPNPFENELIIENNNSQNVDYQIFNLQNQFIQSGKIENYQSVKIKTDNLSAGIYILKFRTEKGEYSFRKIVRY